MNLLAAAKFPLGIVAVALVLVFALITKKAKLPPLWHSGAVAMALITVAGGLALAFYQTQQETERLRIVEPAKESAKTAAVVKPAPSAAASAASSGQNITLGNIGASASVVIDQQRTSASGAQSIGAGSVGEGAKVDIKQNQ